MDPQITQPCRRFQTPSLRGCPSSCVGLGEPQAEAIAQPRQRPAQRIDNIVQHRFPFTHSQCSERPSVRRGGVARFRPVSGSSNGFVRLAGVNRLVQPGFARRRLAARPPRRTSAYTRRRTGRGAMPGHLCARRWGSPLRMPPSSMWPARPFVGAAMVDRLVHQAEIINLKGEPADS
jgi:hypothetical protein